MPLTKITDRLTVAGQPDRETIAGLRARGFAAFINARPDLEETDQLGHHLEQAAAREAGLTYSFVPVRRQTITEADVRGFQQALAAAKGPVFAHCKGGTRALILYALGEALDGRMKPDEVEGFGRSHGFDLSAATLWLRQHRAQRPQVKAFFDARTWSIQYVVIDPATRHCAIIDPVYDFDEKSGSTATTNADAILNYVETNGLTIDWILDTHPHADHFSAASYMSRKTGAPTAIGVHVKEVQRLWQKLYHWPEFKTDGSQWDRLFNEGDTFRIGSLEGRVMFSPGHTLASATYVIGDAAFVHDTIFMPDSGTARADFPGGSAKVLWTSISAILALPEETRLFTGHDYQPNGRHPRWESTVGQQKRENPHLTNMDEAGFVHLREARDRTLPMPKLILHALQVNICGGRLPTPEANGRRYLKIPLDALEGAVW